MLTGERAQIVDMSSPAAQERSMRESEPPRVGSRVAAHRDRALARQLSGDLENIIAMAIAKEAERRYNSAADLDRGSARVPVGRLGACLRSTKAYRARKFLTRHRAAVLAGELAMMA